MPQDQAPPGCVCVALFNACGEECVEEAKPSCRNVTARRWTSTSMRHPSITHPFQNQAAQCIACQDAGKRLEPCSAPISHVCCGVCCSAEVTSPGVCKLPLLWSTCCEAYKSQLRDISGTEHIEQRTELLTKLYTHHLRNFFPRRILSLSRYSQKLSRRFSPTRKRYTIYTKQYSAKICTACP